ncbi:MAG: tRNA preQ1(34) S-adenosylmethionine ribosyltransferase-isomerase QueA [Gemmatimonadetes bacterium]|jgi:S-adenosylmethionine:tRNA ribosyltransferase-isomerase|nr:tRNA preQ1(34) S-adenosylmethionine ribosyltransferase-isomerase QueA [Gemmatimonadota bacterium]MBT5060488.1 tRNA preQ1(34) S-adenosylmethionine ribosyltransferase-isomerase QueA [Gemmatimonadota bacterium]MBT5142541.1 tRNA preQ1(34) S-adenosylmethionine ribosyltransferase-isomerase QueA [Gemmatimonadota bacterium]MBT5587174.1 tRNA preQ1(34) S-adenosylmethionine ribosyltransferase-isomerase QueA [Gemmatimonadota bacterium]MBT5961162.1 tRNA preQ1(34) S-adenosylmethionine ribosyltransferase-i
MHLNDLDFQLPDSLIALHPAARRDGSRLLVLNRDSGAVTDATFPDLLHLLRAEDVLVLNETRVVPVRLRVRKPRTGGKVELLVLGRGPGEGWLAMAKPLKGLSQGLILDGDEGLQLQVIGRTREDRLHFRFLGDDNTGSDPTGLDTFLRLTAGLGEIPLPPYIRRALVDDDEHRYQTVFARSNGSIAAPTAGLHFTQSFVDDAQSKGVAVERLVLHVGAGTFAPVRDSDPGKHRVEAEYYHLSKDAAERIQQRRQAGGRVVAVGTTCVRALETCAQSGTLAAGDGWTDLVITPEHEFQVVDAMVTNFHLPRSSLLMLVSSFAGVDRVRQAYRYAVDNSYRFYSYGDAMFIHGDHA